jgi:ribosomal protein S1
MRVKKLFALFLSLAFLVGTASLAAPQEKKMAAKAKTAEGTVKSVSDTSLVVEGKDKKEWTFAISGKVAESTKKLKAGDAVKVSYTEDGGKMMASKVSMAKMEKKAANPCAAKGATNPCAAKK